MIETLPDDVGPEQRIALAGVYGQAYAAAQRMGRKPHECRDEAERAVMGCSQFVFGVDVGLP